MLSILFGIFFTSFQSHSSYTSHYYLLNINFKIFIKQFIKMTSVQQLARQSNSTPFAHEAHRGHRTPCRAQGISCKCQLVYKSLFFFFAGHWDITFVKFTPVRASAIFKIPLSHCPVGHLPLTYSSVLLVHPNSAHRPSNRVV